MKAKITLNNIRAWFEGTYRYKIYYSVYLNWLMRKHIKEQIEWRISIMDKECYVKGSCKMCGCGTTALQMANKPCDKPCYPKMYNRRQWKAMGNLLMTIQQKNPELFYRDYVVQ